MAHKCLTGCGQSITWSFAICSKCEKIYGNSPYGWPNWLRYLWQETQRQRRRDTKIKNNEVTMAELEEDFDMLED